jgi:hypothetical protein
MLFYYDRYRVYTVVKSLSSGFNTVLSKNRARIAYILRVRRKPSKNPASCHLILRKPDVSNKPAACAT